MTLDSPKTPKRKAHRYGRPANDRSARAIFDDILATDKPVRAHVRFRLRLLQTVECVTHDDDAVLLEFTPIVKVNGQWCPLAPSVRSLCGGGEAVITDPNLTTKIAVSPKATYAPGTANMYADVDPEQDDTLSDAATEALRRRAADALNRLFR